MLSYLVISTYYTKPLVDRGYGSQGHGLSVCGVRLV